MATPQINEQRAQDSNIWPRGPARRRTSSRLLAHWLCHCHSRPLVRPAQLLLESSGRAHRPFINRLSMNGQRNEPSRLTFGRPQTPQVSLSGGRPDKWRLHSLQLQAYFFDFELLRE